jgi:tRNA G18 (ribose-2'-O)-methylase SpoU
VVFRRLDTPVAAAAAEAKNRQRYQLIASAGNPRFKALKKLLTSHGIKKSRQALLAGHRPVAEALERFPQRCLAWIGPEDRQPPPPGAPAALAWTALAAPLFRELDIFGTGRPLVLLQVPDITPWDPNEGFPPGCSLLLPFQDPENLGTAIRSAAAFGVAQVILLSEAAHPFHPRALRASSGAALAVRLRQGPRLADLPGDLPVVALSPRGLPIGPDAFPAAFGLLPGIEGPGLPPAWQDRARSIPIQAGVESLNAASATAIALYVWRQSAGRMTGP